MTRVSERDWAEAVGVGHARSWFGAREERSDLGELAVSLVGRDFADDEGGGALSGQKDGSFGLENAADGREPPTTAC